MTQNPTQSSGTPSQTSQSSGSSGSGSQPDPNTKLLEEIASLARSVKELAERSAPPPTGARDPVIPREVGFAYNILGSLLGRDGDFDVEDVLVAVTRSGSSLTFTDDLGDATAARVRARLNGVDKIDEFENVATGSTVKLSFDSAAIEGIELLDKLDGAVVALGRLEP
jgi:hypothetical protein